MPTTQGIADDELRVALAEETEALRLREAERASTRCTAGLVLSQ